MKLRQSTIEKSADVLIRLGEATLLGSTATIFVNDFQHFFSALGIIFGTLFILSGLYVNNIIDRET